MFTPEDDIDQCDQEIGRLRRELWMWERSDLEGRVVNRKSWWARGQRLKFALDRELRQRERLVAEQRDADEAWLRDSA